jgi:hypothetical protein
MDGINPTLAFGVLLLGLSGNARDAPNDLVTTVDVNSGSGCPALMMTADPSQPAGMESWADAFWKSAASVSVLPDVIDPKWTDPLFPAIERALPTGDPGPQALEHGSDPIMRQAVPTGNVLAVDTGRDPCGP